MQDQQLSLDELAAHFKVPAKRLHYCYERRDDCPLPVAHRKNQRNWTLKPLFSLNEITVYLRELGLIPREPDPNKITLLESAKLLDISYTRTKELQAQDPKFPPVIGGKPFWQSHAHLLFNRADMIAYKLQRKAKKGPQEKLNVTPIEMSGSLNANIRQFLASPSGRMQRAQTLRARTEGRQ